MMKIYNVTFNDGGWHSGPLPNYMVVAESKDEAIEMVLKDHPYYAKGYDKWASEFKIEGYVIRVFDEKTYIRNKNIKEIVNPE